MRNKREFIACALDVGSGRIKAALGKYNNARKYFEVLAAESVISDGIKSGAVSDMPACTKAISEVLEKVEAMAKKKFSRLFLVADSSVIGLDFARGVCLLEKEKRITCREIERAVRGSVEFYLPLDRKLVEVVIREFVVDGQRGIANAEGMFGRKIEVDTILIHSNLQKLSNLIMAVEEAGYSVDDVIAAPQAQAEYFLSAEKKEMGAVIIDIGEETMKFTCFRNNFISEIKKFNLGLSEISKRLSYVFQIPYEYARRLSQGSFNFKFNTQDLEEHILLEKTDTEYKSVLKKDICLNGLEAAKRILDVVYRYLNSCGEISNFIFCGGAVFIDGFFERLEEYNQGFKPAKISSEKIRFHDPSLNSPLFFNSICGCAYAVKLLNEKKSSSQKKFPLAGAFYKLKDLMEEYF